MEIHFKGTSFFQTNYINLMIMQIANAEEIKKIYNLIWTIFEIQ